MLFYLAAKKLSYHKFKTLLIALPSVMLTAIVVALAGWAGGLQYTVQKEVLEPIEQQKILIGINESGYISERPPELKGVGAWDSTDSKLIDKALKIPGIVSITPNLTFSYPLNANINGIDKTFKQFEIFTLDESLAELYGVEDFSYQTDKPIPIIVGKGFLREMRLSGQQHVVQTGQNIGHQGFIDDIDNSNLLSSDLIGKTGTFSFPMLPPQPQAVDVQTIRNNIHQKSEKSIITTEQLSTYNNAINKAILPYWNIEQLEKPVQFRFKIVGIDKSRNLPAYIPEKSLVEIMRTLQSRQQQARTAAKIPAELMQEQIYASLIHDDQIRFTNGFAHDLIIAADKLEKPTFTIPGLFAKAIKHADGTVSFEEVSDYKITKESFVNPFLLVRISSYSQYKRIATELHNIGLYSGGISQFTEYDYLFGMLMQALGIGVAILSAIAAIVLFILCWGYIEDSNREIGALRAFGLRLSYARWLVAWQLAIILAIGLIAGIAAGIGLMHLFSSSVADFINTKLLESIGYTELLDGVVFKSKDLQHINWQLAGLGLAVALILPILSSLIATHKRLQLNPVEALKKDN